MTNPIASGTTDPDEGVLQARAAELARAVDDVTEAPTVDLIPFSVGGQAYAVPAAGVREVRHLQVMARVPRSPASLLGVTRVRSAVVPVFDLPRLLDLDSPVAAVRPSWVLVLGGQDQPPLGLAADWVDGVQPHALAEISAMDGHEAPAAMGVTPQGMVVLDPDALLAAPAVFATPTAADLSHPLHAPDDEPDPERGTT